MSGLQNKLGSVKDSIASLFKKRHRSAKNGSISTPQNVKRVMHITFDSGSQVFDGIPTQWRQYFEAPPVAAEANVAAAEATANAHAEERALAQVAADTWAKTNAEAEAEAVANVAVPEMEAEAAAPIPLREPSVAEAVPAAPRELLSLVFDRDTGQFVNLPPHWVERLQRNNLLAPEFQSNPHLLPLVFSLMDQELRSMREEGARVESCLYTSPTLRGKQSTGAPPPPPSHSQPPPYVFRIEADKSNSSSELDLADQPPVSPAAIWFEPTPPARSCQSGSYVTVRAVELPDAV